MDKNHITINYYVDWKTTDWLKDLFEQNNMDFNEVDWVNAFGGNPKTETPHRAPSLNNKQNGI